MEPRPLPPPHQWVGWGCMRGREGAQPGQPTPADHRVVPYRTTSCSAYKAGGRRRKGDTFGVMAFVFPSNPYVRWSPAFLGWLNSCLPTGRSERILRFALLICVAPPLTIKLSLSQSMSFLTFTLPVLPPIPSGEWASGCVVLRCRLGLNHNILPAHTPPPCPHKSCWKLSLSDTSFIEVMFLLFPPLSTGREIRMKEQKCPSMNAPAFEGKSTGSLSCRAEEWCWWVSPIKPSPVRSCAGFGTCFCPLPAGSGHHHPW